MNHDLHDHTRDLNHDGVINHHDTALFHNVVDKEQRAGERRPEAPDHGGEPWTVYHSFAKGLLLTLFGGFLALLISGVLPNNGFTTVLALLSAVAFLRTLLL